MGLPGSVLLAAAKEAGLRTVTEAFADRGYTPEGTLVPRSQPVRCCTTRPRWRSAWSGW